MAHFQTWTSNRYFQRFYPRPQNFKLKPPIYETDMWYCRIFASTEIQFDRQLMIEQSSIQEPVNAFLLLRQSHDQCFDQAHSKRSKRGYLVAK